MAAGVCARFLQDVLSREALWLKLKRANARRLLQMEIGRTHIHVG